MAKVEALWDGTHVHAIREDGGQERPTGAPQDGKGKAKWVPLVRDYPDDYLPRFPRLLGMSHFDLHGKTLHQCFEAPDFTPQAVRGELVRQAGEQARMALGVTDWQVTRKVETGKDVDPKVAVQRKAIRARHDELVSAVGKAKPSQLPDFDVAIPPTFGAQ